MEHRHSDGIMAAAGTPLYRKTSEKIFMALVFYIVCRYFLPGYKPAGNIPKISLINISCGKPDKMQGGKPDNSGYGNGRHSGNEEREKFPEGKKKKKIFNG